MEVQDFRSSEDKHEPNKKHPPKPAKPGIDSFFRNSFWHFVLRFKNLIDFRICQFSFLRFTFRKATTSSTSTST